MTPTETKEKVIDGEFKEEAVEKQQDSSLAVVEPNPTVALSTTDPTKFIESAAKQADALKRVIDSKHLSVRIGGGSKEHVLIDGWQTLMALNGVMPHTVALTRSFCAKDACVYPGCPGGKLTVTVTTELRRVADQLVLTRVEAECSQHETRWAKADHYAVTSMAQTRGIGKGARQLFGWVMALAGYDATPAEEMPETANATKPAPKADERPKTPWKDADIDEVKAAVKHLTAAVKDQDPEAGIIWQGFRAWFNSVTKGLAEKEAWAALFADDTLTYAAKKYLNVQTHGEKPETANKAEAEPAPAPAPAETPAAPKAWHPDDIAAVRGTYRAIFEQSKKRTEEGKKAGVFIRETWAAFMKKVPDAKWEALFADDRFADEAFALLEMPRPSTAPQQSEFDPSSLP